MAGFLKDVQDYVGFTLADGERLHVLRSKAAPHYERIVESFYDVLMRHAKTRAVMEAGDTGRVDRLKATLRDWMETALAGPWDEEYYEKRARIGRMHVAVQLPQQYVVTAMSRIRVELQAIVADSFADDGEAARATSASLDRLLDIELAIMLHSYIEERDREQAQRSYLERELRKRFEGPLLGVSKAVEWLREQIGEAARGDGVVTLLGEPGVGLQAVARAIHDGSDRAGRMFVYLNCALAERDSRTSLFGSRVRKVADPRAPMDSTIAQFDLARGGTLFLEGIQQLSEESQKQLVEQLRDVPEGAGRDTTVRVIATLPDGGVSSSVRTSMDHDFARMLDEARIRVPPLVERREDIQAIAEYYARQHASRLGKRVVGISEPTVERLRAYRWPGNVQELESVIERATIAAKEELVEVEDSLLDESISMGSYKLTERIGEGAMGEVWKAKHQLLARPAAIKIIRTEMLGQGEQAATMTARFQREAETTSQLNSAHTVQLYDFGVAEDGSFYYVMELLNGLDLEELVTRFGPLPPSRVVRILVHACRALAEAHARDLVHRDIKPANLYLACLGGEPDFVKVLDFGMVKTDPSMYSTRLTTAGSSGGTPAYMAPEAATGDEHIDGRADLYAIGCTGFFLLTGQLVFEGSNSMRMLVRHLQEEAEPPSARGVQPIPEALDRLILDCLAKKPEDRPDSARDVLDRLADVETEPWSERACLDWWREHVPSALDV